MNQKKPIDLRLQNMIKKKITFPSVLNISNAMNIIIKQVQWN